MNSGPAKPSFFPLSPALSLILAFGLLTSSYVYSQEDQNQDLIKKIHGNWVGHTDLTKQYWKSNNLPANEKLLKRVSEMKFSFLKGGAMRIQVKQPTGDSVKIKGSYEIANVDKAKRQIQIKFKPKGAPEALEVTLKLRESDKRVNLAITPINDPTIILVLDEDQLENKENKSDVPTQNKSEKSVNMIP